MAKKELQDEMTLELRKPIMLGTGVDGTEYRSLDLREPVVDEILKFSKTAQNSPGEAIRGLIAQVAGVPNAVVGRMTARDFNIASEYLLAFVSPQKDEAADDEATASGN